jgi:hypothetical protein
LNGNFLLGNFLLKETSMTDKCVLNIIDAADPADEEDIGIRKSLVAALREGGIEMLGVTDGRCSRLRSRRSRGVRRLSLIRPPSRRTCMAAAPRQSFID